MTAVLTDPSVPDLAPRLAVVDAAPHIDHHRPAALAPEVYRRRRLAVVAIVIGVAVGVAAFGRSADATPTPDARVADAVVLTVQPGDTLWDIAEALAPGSDPRPLVGELTEIAGSSALEPGQELVIPRRLID